MRLLNYVTRAVAIAALSSSALMVNSLYGQQGSNTAMPKGAYVFTEDGISATSLASMTFSDTGTVTGIQIIRGASNSLSTFALEGTYTPGSANTGTLSLNGASTDATDDAGNPVTVLETFKLITAPSGELIAIRLDPGVYTIGRLTPAGTVAPGAYVLAQPPTDVPYSRVVMLKLDADGNVGGLSISVSLQSTLQNSISGTHANQANGFNVLTLISQTGADQGGNIQPATETYVFLPTQKDIRMMRIDRGGHYICTLSR